MKKIIKILLFIVVGIVIILTAVYAYYDGFKSVNFEVRKTGGEIFVYNKVLGDYSQSPVIMDSIYYALLNDYKIETTKGAGIYYDSPDKVAPNLRRSDVGCLLDTPVDSITMATISKRFKVKTMPEGDYIITQFENKGWPSIMVGIMKIYPALNDYIEKTDYKKDGPIMEIYDTPNKVIIYRKEALNK